MDAGQLPAQQRFSSFFCLVPLSLIQRILHASIYCMFGTLIVLSPLMCDRYFIHLFSLAYTHRQSTVFFRHNFSSILEIIP